MKEKYCPIFSKVMASHRETLKAECFGEQCAWYESIYQECAIISIGRSLARWKHR